MDRTRYIRVPDGNTRSFLGESTGVPSRGRPIASIQYRFTGDRVIAVWTICHDEDTFSYAEARRIAQEKIKAGQTVTTKYGDDADVAKTLSALPHTVRRAFAHIVADQRVYLIRQQFAAEAIRQMENVNAILQEVNVKLNQKEKPTNAISQ